MQRRQPPWHVLSPESLHSKSSSPSSVIIRKSPASRPRMRATLLRYRPKLSPRKRFGAGSPDMKRISWSLTRSTALFLNGRIRGIHIISIPAEADSSQTLQEIVRTVCTVGTPTVAVAVAAAVTVAVATAVAAAVVGGHCPTPHLLPRLLLLRVLPPAPAPAAPTPHPSRAPPPPPEPGPLQEACSRRVMDGNAL